VIFGLLWWVRYLLINEIMTPEQVLTTKINIAQEQLTIADNDQEKKNISTRIQKLKLEREIAIIRRKIEQLS
jgi:hypothetical protein